MFVSCIAGYDGGMHQTFVIEVHEQRYYDDFAKKYRESPMDGAMPGSSPKEGNKYNSYGGLYSGTTTLGGMTLLPPSPISRLEMIQEPRFALENLPPGTAFTLVIYAKNEKVIKSYEAGYLFSTYLLKITSETKEGFLLSLNLLI